MLYIEGGVLEGRVHGVGTSQAHIWTAALSYTMHILRDVYNNKNV